MQEPWIKFPAWFSHASTMGHVGFASSFARRQRGAKFAGGACAPAHCGPLHIAIRNLSQQRGPGCARYAVCRPQRSGPSEDLALRLEFGSLVVNLTTRESKPVTKGHSRPVAKSSHTSHAVSLPPRGGDDDGTTTA